ncbi:plastocyanin [Mycoplana sp. BE70]|uniref:cupredoxin domain-containing protein n=1 Tax=Mycoplana sp. BE70 TaxID=2817775 RepID=UPI002862A802|nr:cupredoxin family copper-binding protein [Mycoplana sp. BE70]MDR6756699.1 plastocyanin [Mycoplana sp. BE70]
MGRILSRGAIAGALMALLFVPVSSAAAAEHQITIAGMKFIPASMALKAGDVVIWKNDDMFRHTATARSGSFDVDLPPKTEKRVTITTAGAVDYFCRFHPAMKGKLEVEP